jgi:hypothetical protein
MAYPKMYKVHQRFDAPVLKDIEATVEKEFSALQLQEKVKPGQRIAVTAGSRGITNIPRILATVVAEIKKLGAEPFIVPAMGSHGGATAEGQKEVLRSLGITEETMGCPIVSSMEVEVLGNTDFGANVYIDKNAFGADGIVVVNRIKPHTGFRAANESGLLKMMAVGLGKHKGCVEVHKYGLGKMVLAAGRIFLEKAPIVCGIGIVENVYEETAIIKGFLPKEMKKGEAELLELAKSYLPRLPFDDIDVLIVEEMGKNISGTGMDVNVLGRMMKLGEPEPDRPRIKRIVVLDLTEESHGNALGMGLADVITQRFYEKINFAATYENVISAAVLERGRMPVFRPTDEEAVQVALASLGNIEPEAARIVRIKNTLELAHLSISEAMVAEAKDNPALDILGDGEVLSFIEGNIV